MGEGKKGGWREGWTGNGVRGAPSSFVGGGVGPSLCTPVAMSGVCMCFAGGGSLSIRGCLCVLVVVVGRVLAWWVLAAVERHGLGVVGLEFVVCEWFLLCLSSLVWGVVVGGCGMLVGDHCVPWCHDDDKR
jgi:hypothetical protein